MRARAEPAERAGAFCLSMRARSSALEPRASKAGGSEARAERARQRNVCVVQSERSWQHTVDMFVTLSVGQNVSDCKCKIDLSKIGSRD
jgi:hypothetical protein